MKLIFLYIMSLLYIAAGINHFVRPGMYKRIMPAYLPWHLELVYISGACEILFGLLLLPVATRPTAAWLIIGLLLAVFPANIQMAVNYARASSPWLWIALLRLPLQLVLIWWAWCYTR